MMIKVSRIFLCFLIILIFLSPIPLCAENKRTTFFNQQWLKSVVSIEEIKKHQKDIKYSPVGTGFLIPSPKNHIVLVTAKHVIIDEAGKIKGNLAYRLNLKEKESYVILDELIQKIGAGTWFLSKESDVAVRFLFKAKESDIRTIPLDMFIEQDHIQPGTPALILGFPLGYRSEKYSTPIVRKAIVALNEPKHLIIDGFAFPGNSGGPVVYMPAFQHGTIGISNYLKEQRLIGLVSSYLPYRDIAISKQTKRPRIIFEDNSGLTIVIPSNEIINLMNNKGFQSLDQKLLERSKKAKDSK